MDKLERIRRLKEARKEASEANKKEVVMERRQQRLQEKEIIKLDNEEGSKKSDKLDKTIKQLEAKQATKKQGFQNYSQVAAQTYSKEIAAVNIDKHKYDQVKMKGSSNTLVDNHQPSEEAKKVLVEQMKENDGRKRKRKTQGSSDSYINQKNRDFNRKLDRQYGKLD